MQIFTNDYLDFFKELAPNNNKAWFDEHRKRYEKSVKAPFKSFVAELIQAVNEREGNIKIEPKDAIFRINRDIRFAKDKTPYKLNCSAVISPGGKKDKTSPGLYVEAGPEDFKIYGGVYLTDKQQLQNIRSAIANQPKQFQKLLDDKNFKSSYGEIHGEKNKRIDKQFVDAAASQPLIYNKNFYYFTKLAPEVILDEQLMDVVMGHYDAATPMRKFLAKSLQTPST